MYEPHTPKTQGNFPENSEPAPRDDDDDIFDIVIDEAPPENGYIDEYGRDEMGREHDEWLAAQNRWEADYERHLSRIAELDAEIERARRDTQHYEARIARANGRIAWFRMFRHVARRAAARRFAAAAYRAIAATRRRPIHVRRVARNHACHASSRASSDDAAAASVVVAIARKAVR